MELSLFAYHLSGQFNKKNWLNWLDINLDIKIDKIDWIELKVSNFIDLMQLTLK